MASYTRLGSYLLARELSADPFGKTHMAITLSGSAFDRHHLVRTFSPEILELGLGAKLGECQKVADLLVGSRGFGTNYLIEAGKTGHVGCDYVSGRSLAQVLSRTFEEQIPLGVDHSLSVLQGMTQSLMTLNGRGCNHGALSPHSVWISFEGSTQILDAPYAAALQGLIPKVKSLEAALSSYRPAGAASPIQQDLFALGAMLFELLTLEKLPAQDAILAALAKATLKAAQEEGPIPSEIRSLLNRLLMGSQPFTSVAEFNKDLERVLYDGNFSPTTFNMAFFMHTLFRKENEQDSLAMKGDQSADFSAYLSSDTGARPVMSAPGSSNRGLYVAVGAAVLVAVLGLKWYINRVNNETAKIIEKDREEIRQKFNTIQQQKAQNDEKLLQLAKQEAAQKQMQEQLAKKANEGKNNESRVKARKDLEESRVRASALAKEKKDAEREDQKMRMELAEVSRAIVQASQRPAPAPPAPPPAKQ